MHHFVDEAIEKFKNILHKTVFSQKFLNITYFKEVYQHKLLHREHTTCDMSLEEELL